MNKLGWFLAGAGVTVVGLAAFGIANFVEAEKNVRYVSDTTGDYEIDMMIQPGRVPAGQSQIVVIKLTRNGQPVANANVAFKTVRQSGTVNQTLTTDMNGVVGVQAVSFKVQTITFTASYTTPDNKVVQVSATGKWCSCGQTSPQPMPPQPLPAQPLPVDPHPGMMLPVGVTRPDPNRQVPFPAY